MLTMFQYCLDCSYSKWLYEFLHNTQMERRQPVAIERSRRCAVFHEAGDSCDIMVFHSVVKRRIYWCLMPGWMEKQKCYYYSLFHNFQFLYKSGSYLTPVAFLKFFVIFMFYAVLVLTGCLLIDAPRGREVLKSFDYMPAPPDAAFPYHQNLLQR